jgi:uncharacterized phage protein (TIGR01671 family)
MREIKFRGRSFDNGEWIYGDYHKRAGGVHCIIKMEPDENGKVVYVVHQAVPDTIGQFTGLHDKNGKEIYEGDILLLPANTKVKAYEKGDFVEDKFVQRFAVVWAKQCQGYGLCLLYEAKYDAPDVVGMAAVDRMFVIGNIHDNPELLNK